MRQPLLLLVHLWEQLLEEVPLACGEWHLEWEDPWTEVVERLPVRAQVLPRLFSFCVPFFQFPGKTSKSGKPRAVPGSDPKEPLLYLVSSIVLAFIGRQSV